MSLKYNGSILPLAKHMRKDATPQENHLWYDFLSTHKMHFQRQKVINNYIADFYCHRAKLVIEIDGSQHYTREGKEYDLARTEILTKLGLTVIRFMNFDIDKNFSGVCEYIDKILNDITKRAALK